MPDENRPGIGQRDERSILVRIVALILAVTALLALSGCAGSSGELSARRELATHEGAGVEIALTALLRLPQGSPGYKAALNSLLVMQSSIGEAQALIPEALPQANPPTEDGDRAQPRSPRDYLDALKYHHERTIEILADSGLPEDTVKRAVETREILIWELEKAAEEIGDWEGA